jgi:hypothetical protein
MTGLWKSGKSKRKASEPKDLNFNAEESAILKIAEFCSFTPNFLTFKNHQAIAK